jgi:hypothetical protein
VTQFVGTRTFNGGDPLDVRIRYFDYGVASVELLKRFSADWSGITALATKLDNLIRAWSDGTPCGRGGRRRAKQSS